MNPGLIVEAVYLQDYYQESQHGSVGHSSVPVLERQADISDIDHDIGYEGFCHKFYIESSYEIAESQVGLLQRDGRKHDHSNDS